MPATTALLPQQSCISREVAEVMWLTLGKAQGEVCSRKENRGTACQIFRVYIPLGEIFPSYFTMWHFFFGDVLTGQFAHLWHLAYCSDYLYNVRSPKHDIWHIVGSWMGFPGGTVIKKPPTMGELQKTWVWSLSQKDPLEESMATHFSILARRIRSTEKPGGVQLIMSQTWLKWLTTAWQGAEWMN